MRIKSTAAFLVFILFFGESLLLAGEISDSEANKLDPHLLFLLKLSESNGQFLKTAGSTMLLPGTNNVCVLIKTSLTKAELKQEGINVQSQFGDIFTAIVPLSQIKNIIAQPAIIYIQQSKVVTLKNDYSVPEIRGPQARQQYNVSGKGVIIGIVDTGIDWRHEDFRLPNGRTRIKALLDFSDPGDVNGDEILDGPDQYGGTLYTEEEINNALNGLGSVAQTDLVGHGTHAAGSAAGSGRATSNGVPANTFVGVAPEADLVMVKGTRQPGSQQLQDVDYLNGIDYINSIASALGKPCVINLSLGNSSGPHDGKDLSEQAIDNLLSTSTSVKAVVVSAGNDGDKPIHASGVFGAGITTIETKIKLESFTPIANNLNDYVQFDAWFKANFNFSVKIITPSGNNCGPVHNGQENGFDTPDGAVYVANAKGGASQLNGDKQILIQFYDYFATKPPKAGEWKIIITGAAGRFDLWLSGASTKAQLVSNVDYTMLVGTPGTAFNAITVGSYITKKQWGDIDGNSLTINSLTVGDISDFSSPGPSRDGRVKPEILAPGEMIAASFSSMASLSNEYSMFKSTSSQFPNAFICPDNKHALSHGTSFAAPHVTGAIALLLELDGNKTAQQIRQAIISSARSDNFTLDQNKCGYGKVDALGAFLNVSVPDHLLERQLVQSANLYQNYPNPFNSQTTISFCLKEKQFAHLCIFNPLGQKIRTLIKAHQASGDFRIVWDGKNDQGESVPSGIYFCRLASGGFFETKKMVLIQ